MPGALWRYLLERRPIQGNNTSKFPYLSFITVRCRLTLYVFHDKNNHYVKKNNNSSVINLTALSKWMNKHVTRQKKYNIPEVQRGVYFFKEHRL